MSTKCAGSHGKRECWRGALKLSKGSSNKPFPQENCPRILVGNEASISAERW